MQLITILLTLTAILTFLSGFSVWVGSKKSERKSAKFFTFSVFFAAIWTLSIAIFMALPPSATEIAKYTVIGIYIPALFMDVCLMIYCGYSYKFVRNFGIVMAMIAAIISGLLIYDPTVLYENIILSNEGNSVTLTLNWYYYLYAIFYFINTLVLLTALLFRVKKSRNNGIKKGLIVIGAGIAVGGTLMLIFDVVLPLWNYSLIWIGPMALSIVMILHYYAVLLYRVIQLSAGWLKILSYIIILTSAATVYMLLFYIVFTAIFKVSSPSPAIFTLNFLMLVIILLLLPTINELSTFVRSLISVNQIDLAYTTKKLDIMSHSRTNLNELSGFLADHLHFTYVGILKDDKLYGSEVKPLSTDEIKTISSLSAPKTGVWQEFSPEMSTLASKNELYAVAYLTNEKGKKIGQMVFGKPQAVKTDFTERDLVKLEMLVKLSAYNISGKAK